MVKNGGPVTIGVSLVEVGKLVSRLGGKSVSGVDGDGFWLGFFCCPPCMFGVQMWFEFPRHR